ncbi:hypothetical protein [Pseudoxanthomonas kalamensis]|nr:hypothetical protein [Pseudoxanthomonas kalamensis]
MLHIVKLIDRRFPTRRNAIVLALLSASLLALAAGILLQQAG